MHEQKLREESHQGINAIYKKWDGASSSMEPDIVVQGLQEAESRYGLRYLKFVGDEDSSVYLSLVT